MHICLLSSKQFTENERLQREASALSKAGHTITVCARGMGGTDREIIDGIDVRHLPDKSLYAGPKGLLDGVRYTLRFVQPAWVRAVSDVNDEQPVDVCCVWDLSLVKTGLEISDELDIPLLCDLPNPTLAEDAGESRGGRLRGIVRRVFHSPWRRNRLLTKNLPDADQLITTTEEARAKYVREKGVDPRRVAVVRDTANFSLGSGVKRHTEFDSADSFVVTAFGDRRELESVVEAAARAADDAVSLRLVVVGAEGVDDLETLARRRVAGGRVTFHTGNPAEYIPASDVCVFSQPSQTAETAIPAAFEAMARGVPMVVRDGTALSSLVSRTNAGRIVPMEDTEALTDALVALADPETAAELSENGWAAVEREYNWERDADRLRMVYESLCGDSLSKELVETSNNSSPFTLLIDRLPW